MPPLSKPKPVERTPDGLKREIDETVSTIQSYRLALHRAMSSVRAEGIEIWKEVSHGGVTRRVKRINPAVKKTRECEASMRSLGRYLERLKNELKELELSSASTQIPVWDKDDE
ncbi:MAG: hypothetical protein WA542_00670 [Candidatus Acidiferrum sp.]